mmetsp:Transcript_44232/g.96213  ORF Transcript_44232/g.96213 Transcript_44232/m.96213 type:complete len:207 (-) Transcript_44232:600-1220(-)
MRAITRCNLGQVRSGSLAKKRFQGNECVKFVMNIQAAEKPMRAQTETVNMKRQPSLRGRPRGQVPSNQTHAQRVATKAACLHLRGNHLVQNSLLHLPPAPGSGKLKYHSMAKSAPVSLRPKKWIMGIKGTVKIKQYHLSLHCWSAYWNSSGSHPNSPWINKSTVLAWWRLCSSTNSSHGNEKKSLKGWVINLCHSYGGKVAPCITS